MVKFDFTSEKRSKVVGQMPHFERNGPPKRANQRFKSRERAAAAKNLKIFLADFTSENGFSEKNLQKK